jgi:stearoyl-CoA desaturase (delta-9 desaturase)
MKKNIENTQRSCQGKSTCCHVDDTSACKESSSHKDQKKSPFYIRFWDALLKQIDSDRAYHVEKGEDGDKVDWVRATPFLLIHLMAVTVFFVGYSTFAIATAAVLYFIRMFAITGFYHRYFSHCTFKTSRAAQFIFGVMGCSAMQKGPLWWAAHHRHHHLHSDEETDLHSPAHLGFWRSHLGWFLNKSNFHTDYKKISDFSKFPELRYLNRFPNLVPIALAIGLYFLGELLHAYAPSLGTTGWQLVVWGFVISTICVWHCTFFINSLTHMFGRQRYETGDTSRNSWILALLTLGEGWHNNHHHYCASTRQGFFWWEIDITYYILFMMSKLRIIWDLKPVPHKAKYAHKLGKDVIPSSS